MPTVAFIEELAKRKPGRMSGSGSGKAKPEEEEAEAGGDDYSEVEQDALDDIAGVLGVEDKDREKFDEAMTDLIEACAQRAIDKAEKAEPKGEEK